MIKLYRSQTDNSLDCLDTMFADFIFLKLNYQYLNSLPSGYLVNFIQTLIASFR